MQYTIQDVPPELDNALRDYARLTGKSLNDSIIDALFKGLHISGSKPAGKRDLSMIIGKHTFDEGFDQAMRDFEKVDAELWK